MKKNVLFVLILLLLFTSSKTPARTTLKQTLGKYFLVGTAVNTNEVWGIDSMGAGIAVDNFNAIVPENCMKAAAIHPREDEYAWQDADRTVSFGLRHGMAVIGHCLVWHSQQPSWLFTDADGHRVSRQLLIDRMHKHIAAVVGRYKGKITGWDVVNEAFNDDGSYRHTPWYDIIGPDYIPLAFQFAHEADPNAELYYNDYSLALPAKRQAVCMLVQNLRQRGLRIDAVGMQSHISLNFPKLADYEASIKAFASLGVKVQITELDLNMLPDYRPVAGADVSQHHDYVKLLDPYRKRLPGKLEKKFNNRYLAFFALYRKYAPSIRRITLWGTHDTMSWLNNWPIPGRVNYPLLFNRQGEPKPVVKQIIKLFK